jgi:hypothetical protein
MSQAVDKITESVTGVKTAIDSAIAFITGVAQAIRDNANDRAALTALAAELDAKKQELADAILANTPSEGEPTEPPPA